MGKILIIGFAVCLLFYYIVRKFSAFKHSNLSTTSNSKSILEITVPTFILQNLLKRTLITVGTGFLILIIILVVASKFKLALIALPLSFYLIGQYFVFSNHIKVIKNQNLKYKQDSNTLLIDYDTAKTVSINLNAEPLSIMEVKSVQKNNNIQFGYYEITHENKKYYISNLLAENVQNTVLFNKLKKVNRKTETKLFPII